MKCTKRYIVLISFFIILFSSCEYSEKDEELSGFDIDPSELRILPLEPEESINTFQLKEGFRIEQVAAEPLVVDPMALSFDEYGRLFVVEMRYYPEIDTTKEKLGRIRLLEDTTGDGEFDHSTVFADQLRFPTAVFSYDGGVFVANTPNLLYLKDTTGDGIADVHEVVISGFGAEGHPAFFVQQMPNSFRWGLDNRIHGVTSGNAGEIQSGGGDEDSLLNLGGHDFSFDPRIMQVSKESGGLQHGMSFDDMGRKYVNRQGSHIEQVMYDATYAERNPSHIMPRSTVDIPEHGATAEVFRISDSEPWRELRTRMTVEGLLVRDENQNLQFQEPGGERPVWQGGVGYDGGDFITSASGVTIYRGDAWPESYRGNSFIAEPNSNLVHRDILYPNPDGVNLIARRASDEQDIEFLASTDRWFRPVQFSNAPDGALYIADMYREIIDLPSGVPSLIQRHVDLQSGNDRGRIYRIVPDDFEQPERAELGNYTTRELVEALEHPNGWHNDTAARLLYQRQDPTSIPLLENLLEHSESPIGRLRALYALEGQQVLSFSHVLNGLEDSDPGVRRHAVRLSEQFFIEGGVNTGNSSILERLLQLSNDPDIEVRYQLAYSLGEIEHPDRINALKNIVEKNSEDSWIHSAILNSLAQGGDQMFQAVVRDDELRNSVGGDEFLHKLALMIGTQNEPQILDRVIADISEHADESSVFSILTALGNGLHRDGSTLNVNDIPELEDIFQRATLIAQDKNQEESKRINAIELIGLTSIDQGAPVLLPLLEPDESQAINLAAIESLDRYEEGEITEKVLQQWPSYTPRVRQQVLTYLLARPDRTYLLLNAVKEEEIASTELASTQISYLQSHSDSLIQQQAQALFTIRNEERQEIITSYMQALNLEGDPVSGVDIFRARCASCHRMDEQGYAVGPDLYSLGRRKAELLVDIIDPNRSIHPQNLIRVVNTTDGRSISGIVTSETATSITLRSDIDTEFEVLRSNITNIRTLDRSLMPEGLEEGLTHQEMADLMEFIIKSSNQQIPFYRQEK